MKNHKVTHIFVSKGRQCRQEVSDTANGVFHRLVHPETNRVGSWHNYAAPAVMMVVAGDSNCIEVGLTPYYGKDYRVVTGDEFISAVGEVDIAYKCTIEAAAPTHSRITSFLQKEVDEAFELAKQHEGKFNSECWKAMSKLSEVMLKYKQGPSNNGIIMVLAALSSLKYLVLRSWTYEEQRVVYKPHREAINNPNQDDGFGNLINAYETAYVLHFMYDGIEGELLSKLDNDNKELFYYAS